uniref:Adenosinetriphosphatase n=1 Tax=Opuntia streptacantha TaxID=393608 RepID=A0A7C9AK86_OPUST
MRPASAEVPVDVVEIDSSDDEDSQVPEPRSKNLSNAKFPQSKDSAPASASALTVNLTDSEFDKQKLECRSFWQAGSYEIGRSSFAPVRGELEHARVHPKFLHSNATSHKWAFGAIAELLDNAVDEISNGATFVKVDKILNVKDNSPALLFQDDGGGMDPEGIRKCMSLGYSSKKSNTTIGQYGNGFKTSTMRLGADVIVFTRSTRSGRATQSVGLLSYTFLRLTGQDDVIVPMVDFDISNNWAQPIIYGAQDDWTTNLKTILDWSPFSSREELMMQFEDIGSHGTKVIVYNLWLNDEGIYELSFDDDDEDIKLRDEANRGSGTRVHKKTVELQSHISYRLRYSLRAYASILYLRKFENFKILLRGKPVEQFDIEDELLHQQVVTYKPQCADVSKEVLVKATIGIIKGAPDLRVSGFNVYHKNRLIRPFWKVTRDGSSVGNGVVGVLEANFIEPAHDKQDFERSSLFIRLEARMKQMVLDYWKTHCHFMGYQPPGVHHDRTPAEPPLKIQKLPYRSQRVASLPANDQKDLYSSRPSIGLTPVSLSRDHMANVSAQNASENCEENSSAGKSMIELSVMDDSGALLSVEEICEENIQLFTRCEEHANKEQELKQTVCFLISTPSLI